LEPFGKKDPWIAELPGIRARQVLDTLWRGGLRWGTVLSGLVIDRGASALALILISRRVPPEMFGQYLACFSLATFLAVLPAFGMDTWLLAQGKTSRAEVLSLWRGTIRYQSLFLAAWLVGLILLGFILPPETYPANLLVLATVGVGFDTLTLLTISALRCLNRHGLVSAVQSAASLLFLGIVLFLPEGAAGLNLFALIRALISAGLFLIVAGLMDIRALAGPTSTGSLRDFLRELFPYFTAEVAGATYLRADMNIVSFFLGPLGSAIYGPALNLLQVTFLAPRALFYYIVPRLSSLFKDQSAGRSFSRMSALQTASQAAAGLVLSGILFFFSEPLIQITFGPTYIDSAPVLRLLSPIPFLRSLNFALAAVLITSRRQAQRTRVQVASAIFNVAANLLIVIPLRVPGVALVYVFSEFLLAAGYTFLSIRVFRSGKVS
jgi:O-antigen/teichoic acid export membrane protein